MHVITSDINLNKIWTKPIWVESIYAPALSILQSRTHSGRTASGAGMTRDVAFEKCLSETAEILALEAASPDYLGLTDGLAAHPEGDIAISTAKLEAMQRKIILSWWANNCQARKLPQNWLDSAKITELIARARAGATADRTTAFWHLQTALPCHCVIACSTNRMGQDVILGFGTARTAGDAAKLAATEVMLMELNLYSLMAARGGRTDTDTDRIADIIHAYARRIPALLPKASADLSALYKIFEEGELNSTSALPPHTMTELTPHPASRPVWLCQINDMRMTDGSRLDHPFMAQETED